MRTYWRATSLAPGDLSEPLLLALVKYRMRADRQPVVREEANLISSRTTTGKQMPIIDLDFPHHYEPSSREGHGHLYLDTEMGRVKFTVLMVVLRWCGLIERGFMAWSIRRGGNFIRLDGKSPAAQAASADYSSWLRR